MELEECFLAVGACTVGPTLGLHLQDAEFHAHLNLDRSVRAEDFANGDLLRGVVPVVQRSV